MEEPSVEEQKPTARSKTKKTKGKGRKIILNISETRYPVVKYIGNKQLGWKLSRDEEDENWDVWWTDGGVAPEKLQRMKGFQKINHFPGMVALSRKNNLARNLTRMKQAFPAAYNFFPQTWIIPSENAALQKKFANNRKAVFIVKPEGGCQGRGIFLTKKLDEIDTSEQHYVVQEYLKRPLLIDNLKFDLRIYVLIAGCDPLRLYIHEEGLTRFATVEYKLPSRKNITNMQMHLTNYAVNKNNPDFQQPEAFSDEWGGHKRTLQSTYMYLESLGHDVNQLQSRINSMIVKTLCAVQPSLAHVYKSWQPDDHTNAMCFEILGFDVMIDHKLKPYIIEVNSSPSFQTDSPLDKSIKRKVIRDSLILMNIHPHLRNDWMARKQREAQKRTLLGRNAQQSKETKQAQHIKCQADRDEYETQNIGGFSRIYPGKNQERCYEFIEEAGRIWHNWTGSHTYSRKASLEETPNSHKRSITTTPTAPLSPPKKEAAVAMILHTRPIMQSRIRESPLSVTQAPTASPLDGTMPEVFSRLAKQTKSFNDKTAEYVFKPEYFPEIRFDNYDVTTEERQPSLTREREAYKLNEDYTFVRKVSREKMLRTFQQQPSREREKKILVQSQREKRLMHQPVPTYWQSWNPGQYVTPKVMGFANPFEVNKFTRKK